VDVEVCFREGCVVVVLGVILVSHEKSVLVVAAARLLEGAGVCSIAP
jgi:hypothetical protein